MVLMTKHNGIIIFYDFKYNIPRNKDVRGVTKKEIKHPLKNHKIDFYNVTLTPPIARRISPFYCIINSLSPFLRTHMISVIHV